MTTEPNIIELQRPIHILLDLDTYQGMTDSEIQSLIDYKINVAIQSAEVQARLSVIEHSMDAQLETYRQLAEDSQEMLKSVMSRTLNLQRVANNRETI